MRTVPASAIAKALSGETSCLYRVWWELRHPRPAADQVRLTRWLVSHARAVQQVAADLKGRLEAEVVVHDASGIRGRVDLVETDEEGTRVREVKTGRHSQADILQAMLYMALLRERRPDVQEAVLHRPSGTLRIAWDDAPPELLNSARAVAGVLASPTPPRRIQEKACMWCKVSMCSYAPRPADEAGRTTGVTSKRASAPRSSPPVEKNVTGGGES